MQITNSFDELNMGLEGGLSMVGMGGGHLSPHSTKPLEGHTQSRGGGC